MYGEEGRKALHKLARKFWELAIPPSGRYVKEPALFNEDGVTYIPPAISRKKLLLSLAGATVLITAGILLYKSKQYKKAGKAMIGSSLKLFTNAISKAAI
jgi:hypothetical protein